MPGCAAPNCSRHSNKGFRFPKDMERRRKWPQNCRRDSWKPTDYSRLCEMSKILKTSDELSPERNDDQLFQPTMEENIQQIPNSSEYYRYKNSDSSAPSVAFTEEAECSKL